MHKAKLPANLMTGIEKIDEQHLTLLVTADRILATLGMSKDLSNLEELISYLVSYTDEHFTEEENLMKACSYPAYTAHKAEHDAFTKKVVDAVKASDMSNPDKRALTSFINEVKKWIINHVMKTDVAMAAYVKSHPV